MPAREIPLRRYNIKKPDTFTNVGETEWKWEEKAAM
jgi:hypothetical protein